MIYSSWDIEQNILKIVILGHFLPFYSLKTPKIKILRNQKICWRYHFTCVPNITIIWCMVPEIRSATDRIFCHYGLFFTLFFTPCIDPENQNFEKMKKALEDIIILQMFTMNDSHMIYRFSDLECNRQFFLVILDHFLPLYPLTTQKIKIWKTEKTPEDIIILHECTKNHDHMLYCPLDMARNRFNYFFILSHFFALLKKKNLIKNEKSTWRYNYFTYLYHKLRSDNVRFLRYAVWQMDGKSDI